MNWDAIGAIGELLGAMLLMASLVYVGVQIRDAKRQIRSAAAQARTDAFVNLWKVRLDPELTNAELNARRNPDEVSDADRYRLVAFLTMFLNHYQNTFYQLRVGALEPDQTGALDSMPILGAVPYYRKLWQTDLPKGPYNPEFIQHVDSIVRNMDSSDARLSPQQLTR